MTYTLITANRNYSSWSLRPWVLMRALGIAFTDRIEPFASMDNFHAFRQFSPSGQVPCLIHGDTVIWDSLGIALYLGERHNDVWPQDKVARTWAMCAATEMHGGFTDLRTLCPMNVGVRATLHEIPPGLARNIARIAELWEEGLSRFGGPYLAGDHFGAVDAFFAPVVYRFRSFGIDTGPAAQVWMQLMLSHPVMREWERQALAETHRETAHEQEIVAVANVTADYRATE